MPENILTTGLYDCLNLEDLINLKSILTLGKKMVVGINSDFLEIEKNNKLPIQSIYDRYSLVKDLKYIENVFIKEKNDSKSKLKYLNFYKCDTLGVEEEKEEDIRKQFLYSKLFLPSFDFQKSLICYPNKFLQNSDKIINKKCVFFHRHLKHQAMHLLPYFFLFGQDNVAWYYDSEIILKEELNETIKDFIDWFKKTTGIKLNSNSFLFSYQDLKNFSPNLGLITENWKPYCDYMHSLGAKMLFVDHGICVATRPDNWFAMEWQDYVDYILIAGKMQFDYHLICNGKPGCHNIPKEKLKIIGWPRKSINSNIDWVWDMYNRDYKYKILIIPTMFYTVMEIDSINLFINLIANLCKLNKVVIRPHPDEHSLSFNDSVLFKLFEDSINKNYYKNLVIIPPHYNIHTPDLFNQCDIAIFDKSSLGYEFLLCDKPGISIGKYLWEKPKILTLIDGFPHYDNINDITHEIIEMVIETYKTDLKRQELKKYVFDFFENEWISNFKDLLNNI